ncbi:MAG TPA: SEC-C metal-binding domain-containing protein, partial [Polyangiaceae bacterium]
NDLFLRLWRRDATELRRRFDEVRAAVLSAPAAQNRRAAPGVAPVGLAPPARQPPRNQSCPCGSGKKYKRCCGHPRVTPP